MSSPLSLRSDGTIVASADGVKIAVALSIDEMRRMSRFLADAADGLEFVQGVVAESANERAAGRLQ